MRQRSAFRRARRTAGVNDQRRVLRIRRFDAGDRNLRVACPRFDFGSIDDARLRAATSSTRGALAGEQTIDAGRASRKTCARSLDR